ncbi:hypothetical protein P4T89_09980 [Bacillus nakamurai]|uniref:hypothetical protein n=1 Tax=Bacillus nakamurai TaxID=1793963 RepID=UPI000A7F4767|nr:hypothetical protein [Bacillus nakamurai]MED1227903.1 hypothetical protein [Bacillus nakamurai]
MSEIRLNINEESVRAIGNLDVINLIQYNLLSSCELFGKDTLSAFLNQLEFEQVLIEVMASPSFIEEWKGMIEDKIINIEFVAKQLTRIECALTKCELLKDNVIHQLFF